MREQFCKRIKELRLENKLTQRQIAEKLHIAHVSYLHWEHGKTEPSINSICELCKIFEVSADYLLGLEDEDGRKLY